VHFNIDKRRLERHRVDVSGDLPMHTVSYIDRLPPLPAKWPRTGTEVQVQRGDGPPPCRPDERAVARHFSALPAKSSRLPPPCTAPRETAISLY